MLNPIQSFPSQNQGYRQSIEKNIKQTQITLDQIKHYQHNNILPFSLKQHHNPHFKPNPSSQPESNQLAHSNLSLKLHQFSSNNAPSPSNQYNNHQQPLLNNHALKQTQQFSQVHTQHSHQQQPTRKQHYNIPDQENIQSFSNQNQLIQRQTLSKIQVQVHLTIAKNKFTLKLPNLISTKELAQIVQQFLIDNHISNPTKKNHIKTKNSIIQMVQQKIHNSPSYPPLNQQKSQPLEKTLPQNNFNQKTDQGRQITYQRQKEAEENKAREIITKNEIKIQKNSRKFERPIIRPIERASVSSEGSQQGCSPSFKQSEYVPKSPFVKTSNFSPEPKNKQNKYQQLVSNYYNDRINQKPDVRYNQAQFGTKHIQKQEDAGLMKMKANKESIHSVKQTHINHQQTHNQSYLQDSTFHLNDHHNTSTPKSVYEKWKLKQKSKQNSKPFNQSQHNALKQRKSPINNQRPINNYQNSSNNQRTTSKNQKLKETQNNKSSSKLSKNKWIKKVNDQFMSKSTNQFSTNNSNNQKSRTKGNKFNEKQKQNRQQNSFSPIQQETRSFSNIKKPLNKTPTKNLNKTQLLKDKSQLSNYSPYQQINKFSSDLSPLKQNRSTQKIRNIQNQKNSQVYTIHDQQFPPTLHQPFQMSPDHFYKQGLVFQAKKQLQISQKFKSIYPFTTRNQQINSKQPKIAQNPNTQSRQKYFSSKINNKSFTNLVLSENQKSALHERLYKDDKQKKMKKVQIQANKRILKIAKAPTPQIQINLMEQNLKQIKGLSQQKKMKLIERNISIKQKIREKDKMIDQELQKMIKEGKVKPSCEIVTMRKSPFRKTQLY